MAFGASVLQLHETLVRLHNDVDAHHKRIQRLVIEMKPVKRLTTAVICSSAFGSREFPYHMTGNLDLAPEQIVKRFRRIASTARRFAERALTDDLRKSYTQFAERWEHTADELHREIKNRTLY